MCCDHWDVYKYLPDNGQGEVGHTSVLSPKKDES